MTGRARRDLPARPVHVGAGVLFVVFAVAMWRRKHDEDEEAPRKAADGATFWRATAAVFGVVFVAEWGDLPLPPQPRRPYGLHP